LLLIRIVDPDFSTTCPFEGLKSTGTGHLHQIQAPDDGIEALENDLNDRSLSSARIISFGSARTGTNPA